MGRSRGGARRGRAGDPRCARCMHCYSGFPKPCNRKVESGSDWSELVGQIAHIDHVTRFLQLQDFGKPL